MSHRLDPQAAGASVTLAVRFDAAALAVIDRERQRLEDLTGEPCDRSRALRSVVRRFGELAKAGASPASQPLAERAPSAGASPAAPDDAPPVDRDAKPSKRSKRAPSQSPKRPTRSTSKRSPSPEPGDDAADGSDLDNATVRARFKRSGLAVRPFCAAHAITRSGFLEWVKGRDAKPSTLAKIAAGLDAEGV